MSLPSCPHCGATPFVQGKTEGLQTRCDECNGLITVPENEIPSETEQESKTSPKEH